MPQWHRHILAPLLALGIIACSGPSDETAESVGPRFETRPPDAPRAEPETPGEFAFLRYAINVAGDSPEVCLTFTHPLDPQTDYAPYVAVTPQRRSPSRCRAAPCVSADSCSATGQSLTLRAGLPSARQGELLVDEEVELDFGDRPAFVGFAGDGVILPRRDADGLAIETVNVEAVELEVWRITDRALAFRSITSGFAVGEGEYNWVPEEESPHQVGERIWHGEMSTGGAPNTPVTTVFPIAGAIGTLSPGAYYVAVKDAAESADDEVPARAERWLVITDLAITAYRGADGIDLVVRSLQSARPQAGVELQLVARSNEILATATTDRNGRARFDAPLTRGDGAMAPRLVTAYGRDNDFALLDLQRNPVDLSGHNIGGRQRPDGADGYVWLDRGIYRPGETVHAGIMVRDAEAVAITDRPLVLTVYGPNGIEAASARFEGMPRAGSVFWDYAVPRAAARGEWRIVAEMDGFGEVGSTRFSVEDFVPQRIALGLEADDRTPIRLGETREIRADVRFLYGAPGAGLPIEGRLRIETDPRPFEAYEGFGFGRHDEPFRDRTEDLPDTVADGAGVATVVVDADGIGADATQPLRIRAVVSAIEPGGRAVADDIRIPYRPAPLYIGLRPQFDGRAERNRESAFDVVVLDPAGHPVAAELSWQLMRIDWEYDWYRTQGETWRWRRTRHVVPVDAGILALAGEGAEALDLRALDWGDYQLVVQHGESGISASAQFWVGWGGSSESGVEAPDRVSISGPDEPVAVGDRARVTILPPYPGEAEVVIASDRVLETRSVSIPEGGAELSFEVTEDWGAGAYAMVTVYTPRHPVDRPAPRRAVGVVHLPVDMSERTLEIAFDAPDRIRPDQTLALNLEIDGPVRSGAWVSVAAVDEGILALTRFTSPDPQTWYFGKTALDVELHDDYGRLLDPNQGAAAPVRQGGDQIGGAGLTVVPTRTVALFSGPVEVDSRGRATVSLDVPDFNGELRLMAVAWTERAVGQADRPLTVRDDVPAELILPRFLAPGDVSTATLTIDNVDGAPGHYAVSLSAEPPVEMSASDSVELAANERADRRYALTAGDAGVGAVGLAVDGPGPFAVSRDYPIEVRPAWLPVSQVERERVTPGARWHLSSDVLAGYLPGSTEVTVSFSPTPLDEAALLASLSRYPYGCTEQVTSQAWPMLHADRLADLAGADRVGGARAQVQEAIATILSRQSADGVIGLWRVGDRGARPWIGVYATDFLARAREAGYTVPDAALERAYGALEHIAAGEMWRVGGYDTDIHRWRGQTDTPERLADRSMSYALYVLARAGRVDRSRLRYMHDERLDAIESPLARAHLAAALYMIGDRARSVSAFDAAEAALGFENPGNYYMSPRRDLAGVLALAAEAGEAERVVRLAERVAADLPEPARLNTQEKAFLLMAARALSGDGERIAVEAGVEPADTAGLVYRLDAAAIGEGVDFRMTGDASAWMTRIVHGQTVEAPGVATEGLVVQKRLRRLDGSLADLENLVQGDRLIVDIVVAPRQERLIPAVVEDLLPPGFEIEAIVRPEDAGETGIYPWLDNIRVPRIAEARDDRFVAALDLRNRRAERLAYVVRAVTPGRYTLPGAAVEDMYRPDTFARSATGRVVIAPRG